MNYYLKMTRQEIYQQIKNNHLEDSIKESFNGKNYTNLSTIELEGFVNKFLLKNKKKLSGLTEDQSNAQCNVLIVNTIRDFLRQNPTIGFGEVCHRLDLVSVLKTDTSQQVLHRINACTNRYNRHLAHR